MANDEKRVAQIEAISFENGREMVRFDLHITGGLQAHQAKSGFVIKPVLANDGVCMTGPYTLQQLAGLSEKIGVSLLGIDQISEANTALPCRTWNTFRFGPKDTPAADLWSNISANADRQGDDKASAIARRISFSFHAIGIRIRDASDNFHRQLLAVTPIAKYEEKRFQNIQLFDIRLALHSILSELASARDYLACWFAHSLGAPDNVDALNRLKAWMDKPSGHASASVELSEFLEAYSLGSVDPWVSQITHFRNLHLHREPVGAGKDIGWLEYQAIEYEGRHFPRLSYPIPADEMYFAGKDYLRSFADLSVKMSNFAKRVARNSAFSCDFPSITLRKTDA